MRLSDVLSRLKRPEGRPLEAPIRAVVHEVLKEQGFASPAELAALRDEAAALKGRVDALEARLGELARSASQPVAASDPRVAELEARLGALGAPDPRVAELEARLASADARITELDARLAGLVNRPEAPAEEDAEEDEPAQVARLSAEPRGTCKVPGCRQAVRSKGFCSAHYQQWRRGTLKGFVGPDGTVEVDGGVVQFGVALAGEPVPA